MEQLFEQIFVDHHVRQMDLKLKKFFNSAVLSDIVCKMIESVKTNDNQPQRLVNLTDLSQWMIC